MPSVPSPSFICSFSLPWLFQWVIKPQCLLNIAFFSFCLYFLTARINLSSRKLTESLSGKTFVKKMFKYRNSLPISRVKVVPKLLFISSVCVKLKCVQKQFLLLLCAVTCMRLCVCVCVSVGHIWTRSFSEGWRYVHIGHKTSIAPLKKNQLSESTVLELYC